MRHRSEPTTAVAWIGSGLIALTLLVGSAGAGTTAVPAWKGTVTIVDDATHTFERTTSDGARGQTVVTYHDEATYVLTGTTAAGGFQVARMTGTGKGRVTGSYPPNCVPTYSPYRQWSYSGRALVKVTYANGRWIVAPRPVSVEVRSVPRGCSGTAASSSSMSPAPYGIDQIRPRGQKAPASAQTLVGSERSPISFTIFRIAERAGTATLAWKLRRSS